MFPADYDSIIDRIYAVDPVAYGKTRNFLNGAVTRLSPYISRGVVSTRFVLKKVLDRGYNPKEIQKFIQELTWRDYWQQVWVQKGDEIDKDLRYPQKGVKNHAIPEAIVTGNTGITAVDEAISAFYSDGYLHNHMRMYIAMISCNIGGSHWHEPAKWMYYHLLDADWASNALSWQWVAGANSNKKYYANQENINKYCNTSQIGTFLDIPYSEFENLEIPDVLGKTVKFDDGAHNDSLKSVIIRILRGWELELSSGKNSHQITIPDYNLNKINGNSELNADLSAQSVLFKPGKSTLIYNYYNMDPNWHKNDDFNRVLLLEPHIFEKYPVSEKALTFLLQLCQNIPGIQICVDSFKNLQKAGADDIIYKEHPLNRHYIGFEETREWIFDLKGYYHSFFKYWNKAQKNVKIYGYTHLID